MEKRKFNYWQVMTGKLHKTEPSVRYHGGIMGKEEKKDVYRYILNKAQFKMEHPTRVLSSEDIEFLVRNGVEVPVEERRKTKKMMMRIDYAD